MKTMMVGLLAGGMALGLAACSQGESANDAANISAANEAEFGNDVLVDNALVPTDAGPLDDTNAVGAVPANETTPDNSAAAPGNQS